ncbi:nuclear pore complex protein Nup133 [Chrysoperla carnea]|uniref:nuclear pore complex protein Nup133 n=1 Tax=Chrysoperla carnea TaxID=189513 RepID=UPI001D090A79|nr:nuclear pore complex protein Nup133 [Chrysoperla carnea]
MDKSFHSPLASAARSPISRSPYAPRSKQNSISGKRLSVLPGFKKSSRFSVSGKSTHSVQVVTKTPSHTVECFGNPLPVLITEALTFIDRNTVVSAQISECGYAWVVCGRRLLIWQYKQISSGTRNNSQCYELILPQSDLVHRADLVCIIPPESNSLAPACLAVSPEGGVRYWPSISHEGVSVEQCIELHGEECDTVIYVNNVGCILATTTCSVVLLSPNRRTITSRMLKPPAGWLGGISRRISSLIFGPMSTTQGAETKLVKLLASQENEHWKIYVLAGQSLQKWSLEIDKGSGTEQLIYECEVGRLARDAFHAALWETGVSGDSPADNEVWLLDMQVASNGEIILLAAAVNMQRSPQVHYAIVSIYAGGSTPPNHLQLFTILKLSGLYRQEAESEVFGYRLLICGNYFYLHNQRSVIALGSLRQISEDPDVIEFVHGGDRILGGSVCINTPLFFSKNHGLVTVSDNNDNYPDNLNSSLAISDSLVTNASLYEMSICDSNVGSLTLYDLDPLEISNVYTDIVGQLKAAFLFHVKKNSLACEEIINEIFPATGTDEVNAPLDKTVVAVSRELINDIPAGDPRWAEQRAQRASLGSSSSMQITRQLHDKQKALDLFISFLKNTNLWSRLSKVSVSNIITATSYVIAEHSEKIVAALSLRNLQNEHLNLLERVMQASLEDEGLQNSESSSSLTIQDLFYRSVTRVHRLIQQLSILCVQQSHSDLAPLQFATLLHEANTILLAVLQDVITYRQKKVEVFASAKTNQSEYLPWTAAMGTRGVRDALYTMQKLTLNKGVLLITADVNFMNSLYEQLVSLIDLILDGKKCHLESVRGTEKFDVLLQEYETERNNLIKPLVDNKQYERASILAEKYCDFTLLVQICETTNNQPKLNEYMERFAEYNFSEYVFNYCLRENKPSRLIVRQGHTSTKQNQALLNLVSEYPSLSWLQKIFRQEYSHASQILYNLAKYETEYITRKKSMLSIAKLAEIASPVSNKEIIDEMNSQLNLIAHQEDMPDIIMEEHGYNIENPRVLSPRELIELYIDLENSSLTEFEIKKALDLLEYITDDLEKSDLTHKIWCAAILHDTTLWQKLIESPNLQALSDTIFFKVVDLALFLGNVELDQFMPPLERLLESSELSSFNSDANFQYIMKSGYEEIYRIHKNTAY